MVWGCSWRPEALLHSLFLSAHFWTHCWPSWWPLCLLSVLSEQGPTFWNDVFPINLLKCWLIHAPLSFAPMHFSNQHVFWKGHVVACLSALENEQRSVCVTLGHKLHFVMTPTEEVVVCVCLCMLGGWLTQLPPAPLCMSLDDTAQSFREQNPFPNTSLSPSYPLCS